MAKPTPPLFHRAHYNIIASCIRKEFELAATGFESFEAASEQAKVYHAKAAAITDLAITFAHRFKRDNASFDPPSFLDQCSHNNDLYPISELWEEEG